MNDSQARALDAGQRAHEFAKARPAAFPAGSRAADVLALLVTAITEITQQAARQVAATLDKQEATEQKKAALTALLELMRAINQTARSINQLFPGIADQFKMPRGGYQSTVNYARAYIVAATPISTEFTNRGLPATFLADLQTAIAAAAAAEAHQATALANQTAATAALDASFKNLRTAIRELDVIIHNKYRNDPATLAAWESASHVERAPRKRKRTSPPSSPQ